MGQVIDMGMDNKKSVMVRIVLVLLCAGLVSGCGRIRERRDARLETRTADSSEGEAVEEVQAEAEDTPAPQETPVEPTPAPDNILDQAALDELDQIIMRVDTELALDEAALYDEGADQLYDEIESLLLELERQEQDADPLDDLP